MLAGWSVSVGAGRACRGEGGREGENQRADFERISKFFLLSDQWRIEKGTPLAQWQRLMMDSNEKDPSARLFAALPAQFGLPPPS